jgi:hypothetical protein
MITALTYAKTELKAERFPVIGIYQVCGEYHLTNSNGGLLKDRAFTSQDAAGTARSRILDRARKAHYRAA